MIPCVNVRTNSYVFGIYMCSNKQLVKLHKTILINQYGKKPIRIRRQLQKRKFNTDIIGCKISKRKRSKNPDFRFCCKFNNVWYHWILLDSTIRSSHFFNSLIAKRANSSIK